MPKLKREVHEACRVPQVQHGVISEIVQAANCALLRTLGDGLWRVEDGSAQLASYEQIEREAVGRSVVVYLVATDENASNELARRRYGLYLSSTPRTKTNIQYLCSKCKTSGLFETMVTRVHNRNGVKLLCRKCAAEITRELLSQRMFSNTRTTDRKRDGTSWTRQECDQFCAVDQPVAPFGPFEIPLVRRSGHWNTLTANRIDNNGNHVLLNVFADACGLNTLYCLKHRNPDQRAKLIAERDQLHSDEEVASLIPQLRIEQRSRVGGRGTRTGKLYELIHNAMANAKHKRNTSAREYSLGKSAKAITLLAFLFVVQGGRCAYTGAKLTFGNRDPFMMSLERLNPLLGYHWSNVALIIAAFNSSVHTGHSKNLSAEENAAKNAAACFNQANWDSWTCVDVARRRAVIDDGMRRLWTVFTQEERDEMWDRANRLHPDIVVTADILANWAVRSSTGDILEISDTFEPYNRSRQLT